MTIWLLVYRNKGLRNMALKNHFEDQVGFFFAENVDMNDELHACYDERVIQKCQWWWSPPLGGREGGMISCSVSMSPSLSVLCP